MILLNNKEFTPIIVALLDNMSYQLALMHVPDGNNTDSLRN